MTPMKLLVRKQESIEKKLGRKYKCGANGIAEQNEEQSKPSSSSSSSCGEGPTTSSAPMYEASTAPLAGGRGPRPPPAALHAALASSRTAPRRDRRSLAVGARMEARGAAQGASEAGQLPPARAASGGACMSDGGRF
jgi:hypothetical protein